MPISRIVSNAAKKQVGKMTSAAVASRTMSSPVNPAHRAPSLSHPSAAPAKAQSASVASSASSSSSTSSSPNPKLLKAAQQSIETQRILPGHDEEIDSVEAEGVLETEEEKMMEVDDEDGVGGVAMEIDDQREERNTGTGGDMQRNQKQPSTAAVSSRTGGGGPQQRGHNPAARPVPPTTATAGTAPAASASAASVSTGLLVSNPMSVNNQKALSSTAFVNSVVATRNANTVGGDALTASRPLLSGALGVANPLAARPELLSPTSVSASASAKEAASGGASGASGASGAKASSVLLVGTFNNKAPAAPTSGTAKLSISVPAARATAGAPPGPSPKRRSKRRIQISTKAAENDETKAVMEAMAQATKSGGSGSGLGATASATGRNPLAASDDGRSPVMTRRRTGVPETELLSSKARASLSPQSQPTPRTGNTTSTSSNNKSKSTSNSKRQSTKSNRKSSSGKKSSSGSGSGRRNTSSPQPGVPNVMAAAAVTLSTAVPPHAPHRLPHHPAMSMQLPSNPSSVAPSPLLTGASGPNNGNGGGGRARIFSIDLDSAGIDFGLGPTDGLLPSSSSRKNTLEEEPTSSSGAARLRGMSFELFSFGIGADDILPPTSSSTITATDASGRPRGDSIIFDPVSFCDGGIHETNALTKVGSRRTSIDEVDIMNSPGFVQAPIPETKASTRKQSAAPKSRSPRSRSPKASSGRRSHANSLEGIMAASSPLIVSNSKADDVAFFEISPEDAAAAAAKLKGLTKAAISYTRSSYQPVPQGPFSGGAINLPHGSAAAAAAKTIPKSILPKATSPTNGTTTSTATAIGHINCPVELLNKGGRIGIYLPESRKARIAKFHSTRKNRVWRKRIKYDCRKKLADSRPRIKGRFVKRIDEY